MRLLFRVQAALLLATLLSPALADEFQHAVSKAFPGFQILGPSEIKLDKDGMDPDLYNKAKDRPGLIVGRFDSNTVMDFAALIRGSKLIHIPENKANGVWEAIDYYEGHLVVCLGRSQGGYECTKMKTDPMRIRMPHGQFLTKISPGSQECTSIQKYKPPKPKRDPSMGGEWRGGMERPGKIRFKTEAIGLYGAGATLYVFQSSGMYLECGLTG